MPSCLYALIGALAFAIAHGMHFTVTPVPGESGGGGGGGGPQIAYADPLSTSFLDRMRDDIRIAGIGY